IMNMTVDGSRTEEAIKESNEKLLQEPGRTEEAMELGAERAEEEENDQEYAREAEDQEHEQMIDNFVGVSDMRLEQMYLQGKISQNDYNKEMEAREKERQAEKTDAESFSTQMTGMDALMESGERDAAQLETAFSEDANDNIAAADRMQIIQSLDAATAMTGDEASGEETAKRVVIRA
ncbi:MAG: hypothetical protein K6G03_07070, partial [Lachnospiraceae bacterium]|nr:hypothetical protein [Lachnospiraceae bacterium]